MDESFDFRAFAALVCFSPETQDFAAVNTADLQSLAEIAADHDLSHLLYVALCRTNRLPHQQNDLQQKYMEVYQANEARIAELCFLHESFQAENIPYLLLKEYAFDATYQDLGAVRQNDFDLLIRQQDLPGAKNLLHHLQYQFVPSRYGSSVKELRFKKTGRTSIDLHLELSPYEGEWFWEVSVYESLFERAQFFTLKNTHIPCLSTEDAVIYMLVHTALHHNYVPFAKVVNCWNYLIRRLEQADWDVVRQRLIDYEIAHLGWFCLKNIETIIGIPSGLLPFLKKPALRDRVRLKWVQPPLSSYGNIAVRERLAQQIHGGQHIEWLLDSPRQRKFFRQWRQNDER